MSRRLKAENGTLPKGIDVGPTIKRELMRLAHEQGVSVGDFVATLMRARRGYYAHDYRAQKIAELESEQRQPGAAAKTQPVASA